MKKLISLFQHISVKLIAIGATLIVAVLPLYAEPDQITASCPSGDHRWGEDPYFYNLFDSGWNPNHYRDRIIACGGQINYDRLWLRNETTYNGVSSFPGFHVHWDYRTNSSASCYTKSWDLHMYTTDCPGKGVFSQCPKGVDSSGNTVDYLSGTDYFKYLCNYACDLYRERTGKTCDQIVDQVSENVFADDKNLYKNKIAFALGDPDRREQLMAAIDDLNDLLPYAKVPQCYLSEASSLNPNRVSDEIDYLHGKECLQDSICDARFNYQEYNYRRNIVMEYENKTCAWKSGSYSLSQHWKNNRLGECPDWRNNTCDGCDRTNYSASEGSCKNYWYDYFQKTSDSYRESANYYYERARNYPGECKSACQNRVNSCYNSCNSAIDSCRKSCKEGQPCNCDRDCSYCSNRCTSSDLAACDAQGESYRKTADRYDAKAKEYHEKAVATRSDNYSFYYYVEFHKDDGSCKGSPQCYYNSNDYWYREYNFCSPHEYICKCSYGQSESSCRSKCTSQFKSNCTYYQQKHREVNAAWKRERDWAFDNSGTDSEYYNCHNNQNAWIDDDKLNYRCFDKSRLQDGDNVEWLKDKISLPGYIKDYIEPQEKLVRKRLKAWIDTINDSYWKDAWKRKGGTYLCRNSWALDTKDCIAVNLLQQCLNKANAALDSNAGSSDVSHRSYGTLSVYTDYHACTGDSDLVNTSKCYKVGCYRKRDACMARNPFFVESGEMCTVGKSYSFWGELVTDHNEELGDRQCRNCVSFSNCTEANLLGFHYDVTNDKAVPGYFIDELNSALFWTIRGNCTDESKQICKDIYYPSKYNARGQVISSNYKGRCNVGEKQPSSCSDYGYYDSDPGFCADRSDGFRTPETKTVSITYDDDAGVTHTVNRVCYTGGCKDTCAANGWWRFTQTGCDSTDDCINGTTGDECNKTPHLKLSYFYRPALGFGCYAAKCQPRNNPDVGHDDICVQAGFRPNTSQWQCDSSVENTITCAEAIQNLKDSQNGNTRAINLINAEYTCSGNLINVSYSQYNSSTHQYERRTTQCLPGCKLKDGITDELCDESLNHDAAGSIYYKNTKEPLYSRLAAWQVSQYENIWLYNDSLHTGHLNKVAGNGYYVKEKHTDDAVTVCRFDRCAPNDNAYVARTLTHEFFTSACASQLPAATVQALRQAFADMLDDTSVSTAYVNHFVSINQTFTNNYVVEIGGLYDACDKVYTFPRCVPKGTSCSPSCRHDTDIGYGTYSMKCSHNNTTALTTEDFCDDVHEDGSRSTGTTYVSTVACRVPTCDDGYTLSIDKNNTLKEEDTSGHSGIQVCGQTSGLDCHHTAVVTCAGTANASYSKSPKAECGNYPGYTRRVNVCYGSGGTTDCQYADSVADTVPADAIYVNGRTNRCHTGDTSCYRVMSCNVEAVGTSITTNSKHPSEFGELNSSGESLCRGVATTNADGTVSYDGRCTETDKFIFIPAGRSDTRIAELVGYSSANYNYKAGPNGYRCGKYIYVPDVRWTTSNESANIYNPNGGGTTTAANDSRCTGSVNVAKLNENSFQIADVQMEYSDFEKLIEINKLPVCENISSWSDTTWNSRTSNMDGYYVCRFTSGITGNVVTSEELFNRGLLQPDKNIIIFFDNESIIFHINTNIITDHNFFKAFIARGKIEVDKNVGTLPAAAWNNNRGCSSDASADLQGFFAAKEFDFQHGIIAARSELSPFNDIDTLYCDRQLVIAGNVIQWASNDSGLKLNRTFRGCVGGDESLSDWEKVMANPGLYPNYNAIMSPHVFYQRADFNNSAPNWMKTTKVERYEVR